VAGSGEENSNPAPLGSKHQCSFTPTTITYPYIHEISITTSIISQHNSYDCISTGAL